MPTRFTPSTALLLSLVVGLILMFGTAMVHGQSDRNVALRAERRVVAESRFRVTNAPAQAELVALVVDFPPGARTSLHTHGGQAINLVLNGEITLRQSGMDRPHRAGQSWTDSTGQVHAAGNTGSGPARLVTNFLLPKGAPQITVIQETPFGPSIAAEAKFSLPALAAETEIVSQILDLPSGWRAEGTSDGFKAGVVMEGEVTYGIGPALKKYGPGEAWSAPARTLVKEENVSASKARVFIISLFEKTAP